MGKNQGSQWRYCKTTSECGNDDECVSGEHRQAERRGADCTRACFNTGSISLPSALLKRCWGAEYQKRRLINRWSHGGLLIKDFIKNAREAFLSGWSRSRVEVLHCWRKHGCGVFADRTATPNYVAQERPWKCFEWRKMTSYEYDGSKDKRKKKTFRKPRMKAQEVDHFG